MRWSNSGSPQVGVRAGVVESAPAVKSCMDEMGSCGWRVESRFNFLSSAIENIGCFSVIAARTPIARQAKTRFPPSDETGSVVAMKPSSFALALFISLTAALGIAAGEPKLDLLFNGKDLTNFKAEGSQDFWRVENGVLIGENDAAKKGN